MDSGAISTVIAIVVGTGLALIVLTMNSSAFEGLQKGLVGTHQEASECELWKVRGEMDEAPERCNSHYEGGNNYGVDEGEGQSLRVEAECSENMRPAYGAELPDNVAENWHSYSDATDKEKQVLDEIYPDKDFSDGRIWRKCTRGEVAYVISACEPNSFNTEHWSNIVDKGYCPFGGINGFYNPKENGDDYTFTMVGSPTTFSWKLNSEKGIIASNTVTSRSSQDGGDYAFRIWGSEGDKSQWESWGWTNIDAGDITGDKVTFRTDKVKTNCEAEISDPTEGGGIEQNCDTYGPQCATFSVGTDSLTKESENCEVGKAMGSAITADTQDEKIVFRVKTIISEKEWFIAGSNGVIARSSEGGKHPLRPDENDYSVNLVLENINYGDGKEVTFGYGSSSYTCATFDITSEGYVKRVDGRDGECKYTP